MHRHFQSIALLLVTSTLVGSFVLNSFPHRFSQRSSRLRGTDDQIINDLNLEEMFEVFEAADVSVSSAEIPKGLAGSDFSPSKSVGSSAPLGFFDPAGFSVDVSEDQYKLYQEAEIKHGRVSMLAFLGILFGETVRTPLFDGQITGPAIYQFQQADAIMPLFWVIVLTLIAFVEGGTIINAWQPLEETMKEPLGLAKLKRSHIPGDLKFDLLKLKPKSAEDLKFMKTKELNNGRLAMIAVVGIVFQELATNTPTF